MVESKTQKPPGIQKILRTGNDMTSSSNDSAIPSTSVVTKDEEKRVSFPRETPNQDDDSNLNGTSERLDTLTPRSRSTQSIPSLQTHRIRTQTKRDPFQYYEVLSMLGDGSMGSVCKVKKKKSAVGGSARQEFVKFHQQWALAKILSSCLSFCPTDGGPEETKSGVLAASMDTNDHSGRSSFVTNSNSNYGVVYALKSIILDHVTNKTFEKELQNEIAILRTLDHPNICKAIETYEFENRLYLVLELCSGGDLYTRDPYSEDQAKYIVHSIVSACAFLHRKNIAHRDLKYENIMFASPTSPSVKLIDFGLSKKYSKDQRLKQTVGTVYTMAPEVIMGQYGPKCDVWSTGVLAYMLLSSSLPFFGKTRRDVIRKIMDGKFPFKARRWNGVSQQAKQFVSSLLIHDLKKRPSSDAALKHEWLNCKSSGNRDLNFCGKQVVSAAVMDVVQASIQTFAGYSKLKKLALYVIAHKSNADEVGFLQGLFRNRFDIEKDGVISLNEFKDVLSIYSYTETEVEEMFRAVDIDGCERLSYSEFLAATIEAHGSIEEDRIAEAFDRLDSDDTGFITVSNLTDFLGDDVPKKFIDSIIEEVDVSKDHKIDYDEFLGLWDESFDKVRVKNLEEVREKRLVRDSEFYKASPEEGYDHLLSVKK